MALLNCVGAKSRTGSTHFDQKQTFGGVRKLELEQHRNTVGPQVGPTDVSTDALGWNTLPSGMNAVRGCYKPATFKCKMS